MEFGYIRVSTATQNTSRQLADIELDRIFTDKISGGTKSRPQLDNLIDHVRSGDSVTVHSLDRLGRNLQHVLELIETFNNMGVTLRFVKENMTFTGDDNPAQKLMISIMGSIAEFEKSLINERVAEGRAIAKQKGVKFGRKATLSAEQVEQIKQERESGKKVAAIAIDYDVSRQSVYRAISTSSAE